MPFKSLCKFEGLGTGSDIPAGYEPLHRACRVLEYAMFVFSGGSMKGVQLGRPKMITCLVWLSLFRLQHVPILYFKPIECTHTCDTLPQTNMEAQQGLYNTVLRKGGSISFDFCLRGGIYPKSYISFYTAHIVSS